MCTTVNGWRHLVKATAVTAGLAETNGSRADGLKTACTLGSALGPTLGNEYGRTFTFLARDVIYTSRAYATMSVSVCLSVCL